MSELYMMMYTSLLALDASPTCVTDVVRKSRVNNARDDISGILIFDGMAFCQYLEGGAAAVGALMKRLLANGRHTDVTIRFAGSAPMPRRFDGWSMAYGLATNEILATIAASGRQATPLQGFEALLSSVDREPSV